MTIGNRTNSAMEVLLGKKQLSFVINACETLGMRIRFYLFYFNIFNFYFSEVCTRLSVNCCERMVEQRAIPIIYALIDSCNRSAPHVKLLQTALSILLNITQSQRACKLSQKEKNGEVEREEEWNLINLF